MNWQGFERKRRLPGGSEGNHEEHRIVGVSVEIGTEHFLHTGLKIYYASLFFLVSVFVFAVRYLVTSGHQSFVLLRISETHRTYKRQKIENPERLLLRIV
jgi:hypothetical protein